MYKLYVIKLHNTYTYKINILKSHNKYIKGGNIWAK